MIYLVEPRRDCPSASQMWPNSDSNRFSGGVEKQFGIGARNYAEMNKLLPVRDQIIGAPKPGGEMEAFEGLQRPVPGIVVMCYFVSQPEYKTH